MYEIHVHTLNTPYKTYFIVDIQLRKFENCCVLYRHVVHFHALHFRLSLVAFLALSADRRTCPAVFRLNLNVDGNIWSLHLLDIPRHKAAL